MRVDATVAMALAAELAADHSAAVEQTRQAAFLGLRERLAHHLLLRASLDCGGLALTHRQMAGMVGSVREVVGRVVKQLESAGAIDRSSRGAVEVNVDAMRLLLTDVRQEQHAVNECVPRVS
jgi:CRP-like cAMP-binding protein